MTDFTVRFIGTQKNIILQYSVAGKTVSSVFYDFQI